MIAASYARKSTAQDGADADAKSVVRQTENARAFALAKGWSVPDAHTYADDAISGAETTKLVNRQRLLHALETSPLPFQVLIMRDASRFSRRDGDEAFGELKRIAQRGIEIWFYQDGTRFNFGTFGDNVVGFVRAEMNAEYRRQIAKWTSDAMVRKAMSGHVVGGRVYAYNIVKVEGHKEREINESEAAVVRTIFALCAQGTGYTRIAKQLNAEGAVPPRPQQGRPAAWSPSAVAAILHRSLYRGETVWNKTKTRDGDGKAAVSKRPETEWLRIAQPHLRIVSDDAWTAAHARLGGIKAQLLAHGLRRRRRRDIESKYLLSGFARCAQCGGSISVLSRRGKGGARVYGYGCLVHAKRGDTVCTNALVLPVERADAAVRDKLTGAVLHPGVARAIIAGVFAALRPTTVTANVRRLEKDLRTLDTKIARLTEAVETGDALPPLVAQLRTRQTEREALVAAIAAAAAVAEVKLDQQRIERKLVAQIEQWQALFASNGRQALREVLDGHIRFVPDGKQYRFDGVTMTGKLITGLIGVSTLASVPKGIRDKVETRFSGIAA